MKTYFSILCGFCAGVAFDGAVPGPTHPELWTGLSVGFLFFCAVSGAFSK